MLYKRPGHATMPPSTNESDRFTAGRFPKTIQQFPAHADAAKCLHAPERHLTMAHDTIKAAIMATVTPETSDQDLWDRALHIVTGKSFYFEMHWAPRLKGAAAAVIHAMWRETRFFRREWRKQEDIHPRYEAIASAAHVARSTVGRVLQRDQDGQYCFSWYGEAVGPLIARWIRAVTRRWRIDQATHAVWQTANQYQVTAIMPCIPEHDELVRIAFDELKTERERKANEATTKVMEKNRTHVSGLSSDSCKSPIIGQQIKHPPDTLADGIFDHHEVRVVAAETIRSGRSSPSEQATNHAGNADRQTTQIQPGKDTTKSNHLTPSADLAAPRAAARPASDADRAERDDVAWVLTDKFSQAGSQVPQNAANCLLKEMEEAQVPYAIMVRLVRHAYKKSNADGRNVGNRAGHYMMTARNLVAEASKRKWNLEMIIAADEARWTAARQRGPGALTATERANRLRNGGPGYGLSR